MGNEVLTLADWGALLADKISIAMNNGEDISELNDSLLPEDLLQ